MDSVDEEESFLVHYAKSWENACKAKITEEQNERTYVSRESVKGSGMKTKLKGRRSYIRKEYEGANKGGMRQRWRRDGIDGCV